MCCPYKNVYGKAPKFLLHHLRLDTGAALRWRWAWWRTHQLAVKAADARASSIQRHLTGAQNVRAERLDSVQPFDLYQAGQEVWDAVARRAHSLEEL